MLTNTVGFLHFRFYNPMFNNAVVFVPGLDVVKKKTRRCNEKSKVPICPRR